MPRRDKIVVYTAITGNYDDLKPAPRIHGVRFYAFMDQVHSVKGWETRKLIIPDDSVGNLDDNRRAKWFKLHPHKIFPGYKHTIWIDGSVEVIGDLHELIENVRGNGWGAFKHASRNCIVDEAFACAQLGKDDPDVMSKQVAHYMAAKNYPRNNGLSENTIIVRSSNSDKIIEINERWWEEVKMWSKRDQLSLNYVCWKKNFRYTELPGNVYRNRWFKLHGHKN